MGKNLPCLCVYENSKKTYHKTNRLSKKFFKTIESLTVIPVEVSEGKFSDVEFTFHQAAETKGSSKQTQYFLNERGVRGQKLILEGNPGDVIVDFAKNNGIDLIVIGSKGKDATERTLFGSVTQKVTANAGCSVLVVK